MLWSFSILNKSHKMVERGEVDLGVPTAFNVVMMEGI